jgi:hypothetical protein
MSFTDVYPVNDQPQEDLTRHQSPPPLAFSQSFSPQNPFLQIFPSIPSSSHNDQNHPFVPLSSHNNENSTFVPTSSHNTEQHPFIIPHSSMYPQLPTEPPIYNTHNPHINPPSLPRHPTSLCTALPDIKDSALPSSTYIPLLTGRTDWGSWSDTVSVAIMNMNLYGHIAEKYTPRFGYNPGSKPTYPPIIDENASTNEVASWYDWWHRDGQVSHILFSRLSATARSQLSGMGATHHHHRTAQELYTELVNLFGGTDYNTAAAVCEDLSQLLCAPNRVHDYITRWRTGLNQLHSAGHPFDHADSLQFFVNHLPLGSTYDMI